MKSTIVFFIVLLAIWIGGSSYVYVCKIRKDCCPENAGTKTVVMNMQAGNVSTDSADLANVTEELPVPEKLVVYFESGKSKCMLNQEDQNHINSIKQYLMTKSGSRITVTGHSDITGSSAINSKISLQRAEYIKQLLVSSGLQDGSIDLAGKGELEPVGDNAFAEGRAKNRRVEILIH